MNVAIYVRVSTQRQQQAQTIQQQLERLQAHIVAKGWQLSEEHIFRDEGYSGTKLNRPGLDSLRDRAAMAEFEAVLITAPDRLARNYVHQMVILEELERHGCRVEFLDRPMSDDPHDQLVLQIRGAVAEYEQILIADRMRRGRLRKLQAGQLSPWTCAPYGYILDAERPRDPTRIRINEVEATFVRQMFAWYADLEANVTLYKIAKRLSDDGVPTPRGGARWNVASIRGILKNPAYTGTAYSHRTQGIPARQRKSALLPVGPGVSSRPVPSEEWLSIPVPALIDQEQFDQVQARLASNHQMASRNNTKHSYLLRGLVSCGQCRLSCTSRTTSPGYSYYLCRGKTDALRAVKGQRCLARYAPAEELDALVWQDLCHVIAHPETIALALERAQSGCWLPQQLQARGKTLRQTLDQLTRQEERLLEAYLSEVIMLSELERKRAEIAQKKNALQTQLRQLEAQTRKQIEITSVAASIETFCQQVQKGLENATFAQRRQLIELLIDRVIVNDGQVEIRYVIPTTEEGTKTRFCHLRTDYFDLGPTRVGQDSLIRRERQVRQHQQPGGQVLDFHPDQIDGIRKAFSSEGPPIDCGRDKLPVERHVHLCVLQEGFGQTVGTELVSIDGRTASAFIGLRRRLQEEAGVAFDPPQAIDVLLVQCPGQLQTGEPSIHQGDVVDLCRNRQGLKQLLAQLSKAFLLDIEQTAQQEGFEVASTLLVKMGHQHQPVTFESVLLAGFGVRPVMDQNPLDGSGVHLFQIGRVNHPEKIGRKSIGIKRRKHNLGQGHHQARPTPGRAAYKIVQPTPVVGLGSVKAGSDNASLGLSQQQPGDQI
jgi:site-specific DNA recombinase